MIPTFRTATRLVRSRAFVIPRTPLPSVSQPTLSIRSHILQAHPPQATPFRQIRTSPSPNRSFHTTTPNPASRYQQSQRLRSSAWSLLQRWAARPTFYLEVATLGGITGSWYLYNIEEVPVSGRRRFNVISTHLEQQLGDSQYQQVVQQYHSHILPDNDPRVIQVRRVLARLIPHSGLPSNYDWKVTVIDSQETNAFVIPGGKVFVFTGILPVCADDDGLAAVLGHEIGHNVARHIAEQMSRGIFLLAAAWMVELFWGIPGGFSQQLLQLAIDMPKSRAQESEADHIGLMMMAKSCYDPNAAVTLWERMQIVEKKMAVPPEMLSTHPSSQRRQTELAALLPQAYQIALDSECSVTGKYVEEFRRFGDEYAY
ncbi:hypothetical protein H072_6598 [Dactylellina haptotyla CBS 200.50]|uniref:Peptidase M48 domain-containing protein n=1 Tax=Dactylellina haptotyla (strain CBS 200.50) TaxID=1284197 RepID=S8AEN2_DACHA|nr:hypothetical protein H072_6598 [Dactylellina haptotyla CBS 200.50]